MPSRKLARFSLAVLIYTLAVILWGAYVRATGSGAGCGSHWPVCNGAVLPRAPSTQTLIEFSHRLTSGLSLLLVVALAIWVFRTQPTGHALRRSAGAAVFFMLLEAALGAGLVLLELVALDASLRRAVAMSLHLVNTFLLLGAMGACVHHAYHGDGRRLSRDALLLPLRLAQGALLLVGASGGIAALGDTLNQHGVRTAFVDALIQLRVTHPLLAILTVALCGVVGSRLWRERPRARAAVRGLVVLLGAQLCVGALNVALQAPVAMQLLHLLLADAVWLALIFAGRAALWAPEPFDEGALEETGDAAPEREGALLRSL